MYQRKKLDPPEECNGCIFLLHNDANWIHARSLGSRDEQDPYITKEEVIELRTNQTSKRISPNCVKARGGYITYLSKQMQNQRIKSYWVILCQLPEV